MTSTGAEPILVTGASGNAGREVVRALMQQDIPVRGAVRSPDRAPGFLSDVETVRLDFMEASTWEPAAAACRGVFLLRPPAISDTKETLNPFVDHARAVGAEFVVFLSVAGAGENKAVPHHAVEVHLQRSDAPYAILRPGFFAQNLQDAYRRDIVEEDRIYVPAGRGKVAFVDLHDVADVAARCFAEPDAHAGEAYTLTGPEAVDFLQVAEMLSEVLGREIDYEPATIPGYLWHLKHRRGLSVGHALVQTILHVGLRFGQAEDVDPTLERLLGRPGRTLETYLRENASFWRRESGAR